MRNFEVILKIYNFLRLGCKPSINKWLRISWTHFLTFPHQQPLKIFLASIIYQLLTEIFTKNSTKNLTQNFCLIFFLKSHRRVNWVIHSHFHHIGKIFSSNSTFSHSIRMINVWLIHHKRHQPANMFENIESKNSIFITKKTFHDSNKWMNFFSANKTFFLFKTDQLILTWKENFWQEFANFLVFPTLKFPIS